jgi:hypothetical protein
MSNELQELIRWALQWKANWDETGMPGAGIITHTTNCDVGLYKVIQAYEKSLVEEALKQKV